MTGSFGAMLYMWIRYGKPDASMTGNGLLAGLVAITAPSGFVNPMGAVIIGLIAGVLVCVASSSSTACCEWTIRSARSRCTAPTASGASSRSACSPTARNGVKGLFYGDPDQLVAQLIGVATLLGFVFSLSLRREHGDSLHHRTAVCGGG